MPVRFPIPSVHARLENSTYSVEYDFRNHNPSIVYAKLLPEPSKQKRVKRRDNFREDTRLAAVYRATSMDYFRSGFDRGHMEPASDHAHSRESMDSTFLYSNIIPQNSRLNQGYWKELEKYVRSLKRKKPNCLVHVCTGALYRPIGKTGIVTYEVIGPNNIAVPTHLYKVITIIDANGRIQTEAYISPNSAITACVPVDRFRKTIAEVEKLSGRMYKVTVPEKNGRPDYMASVVKMVRNYSKVLRFVSRINDSMRAVFDRHVQGLRQQNLKVWVCEGPFNKPIEVKGRKFVLYKVDEEDRIIPTHIYKVLTIRDTNGKFRQESYLFPNRSLFSHHPLSHFNANG